MSLPHPNAGMEHEKRMHAQKKLAAVQEITAQLFALDTVLLNPTFNELEGVENLWAAFLLLNQAHISQGATHNVDEGGWRSFPSASSLPVLGSGRMRTDSWLDSRSGKQSLAIEVLALHKDWQNSHVLYYHTPQLTSLPNQAAEYLAENRVYSLEIPNHDNLDNLAGIVAEAYVANFRNLFPNTPV